MFLGYCRVSTDEQAEAGYGLAVQEAKIKSYAAAMDCELGEIIIDDGYSGTSLKRPGLEKAMAMIKAGEAEGLIVAKLDRFSRSLRNLLNLYADNFGAAALISVAERFDTSTPSGRMFFQLLGVFSEFEVNTITERTTSGRRHKARGGGYAGGGAAIGYTATRGAKVLQLDEEKGETVRRVYELKQGFPGWTLRQLSDRLNGEGHTTAEGKGFRPTQVYRILKRKGLYSGEYTYSGIHAAGLHKAIL